MQPVFSYVTKFHETLWEDGQVKVLLGQCIRLGLDAPGNPAHLANLRLSERQKAEDVTSFAPDDQRQHFFVASDIQLADWQLRQAA